ncbi:MAG TPA: HAMP domain-containing sensor histidine kinase, partial [Pirellulales bacterium]|nr:HAMP domain-containing sensor histidine kinase [Pirellulales bacterium]
IASLKLALQSLDRRKLSDQQQADFHRFMFQDLERLDSLIDHLLDAARSEKPVRAAELENVDLPLVLATCVATICGRYHLAEERIRLTVEPAQVRARPIDLEILFRNLIDNAIKYGGPEPQVEIVAVREGPRIVTRIADNGPGIPSGLRRKIFSRFVRLGNELERSKTGTGLGLYIVRTLVKQLRGEIQVHDRGAAAGTLFEVALPLVLEPAERAS